MKTVLELRKELDKIGYAFMCMLYWYFSLTVLFAAYAPMQFGLPSIILLYSMVCVGFAYLWYALMFSWYFFFLTDTNNVPYFLNVALNCYVSKDDKTYKSFVKYHKS